MVTIPFVHRVNAMCYTPGSRERLGKRLSKRLWAGRCFLVAGAALRGRHCGRCSAAHAVAHASGVWAWRVLALAWQVRWQELVARPCDA